MQYIYPELRIRKGSKAALEGAVSEQRGAAREHGGTAKELIIFVSTVLIRLSLIK